MNFFTIICFLALIDDHGEGWEKTHPSYIFEKAGYLESDPSEERAYAALDRRNQLRVKQYFESNDLKLPDVVRRYEEGLS